MGFLRRRLITAGLVANAVRPIPGLRIGAAAFLPGWLASELVPQALVTTLVDTGISVVRGRASKAGLAVSAATVAALGYLIHQARGARVVVDACLDRDLGAELAAQLDPVTPEELATPWHRLVNPFRIVDPRIQVERDVRYADAGRRGLLDIYRPAGRTLENAPVMLQIHGGGWVLGAKEQQGVPLCQHMAGLGWVVVSINYRLAPRDRFPAQIIDVKRAIAWIRQHIAEYGGDPSYVVVTGGSAGGHLTALAALTPNDPEYQPGFEDIDTTVQAAVPHYAVFDIAGATGLRSSIAMRDNFFAPRVVGHTWASDPEVFEHGSPILRIHEEAPDFFVIHGTNDSLVSIEQARLFVAELRKRSRRTVVYAEVPGAQHAFDVFPSIRSAHVVQAIARYLTWHHLYRRDGAPQAAVAGQPVG